MPPDLTAADAARLLDASTPGEWSTGCDCQTGRDYFHLEIPIAPGDGVADGVLATLRRFGRHADHAAGNAEIMAAAPDLARAVMRLEAERDAALARARELEAQIQAYAEVERDHRRIP